MATRSPLVGRLDEFAAMYAAIAESGAVAFMVAAGSPRPGTLRQSVGGYYADQLSATGCFADLTERDTSTVAQVIAWEVVHGDQADGLGARAGAVADGSWAGWAGPHGGGQRADGRSKRDGPAGAAARHHLRVRTIRARAGRRCYRLAGFSGSGTEWEGD
ncbi:hypothetical protein [Mycolicibacterium pulveris]|uniref:hypothetical protein n=1 Tax=Mycolicibacterium pulveris TaxID=36813 RepID=UPI003CFA32D1